MTAPAGQYWCWISQDFVVHRIVGEYLWIWLALLFSLLYIPLIIWSMGYITPTTSHWWQFRLSAKRLEERHNVSVAMIM
jgi:hypothetical protein